MATGPGDPGWLRAADSWVTEPGLSVRAPPGSLPREGLRRSAVASTNRGVVGGPLSGWLLLICLFRVWGLSPVQPFGAQGWRRSGCAVVHLVGAPLSKVDDVQYGVHPSSPYLRVLPTPSTKLKEEA